MMLERGLLEEARSLLEIHEGGRPLSKSALGALGYRELWEHLRGRRSLEDAQESIARQTWQFVRSQLTWLRSFPDLVWFEASADPERDAERIEAALWNGHFFATEDTEDTEVRK